VPAQLALDRRHARQLRKEEVGRCYNRSHAVLGQRSQAFDRLGESSGAVVNGWNQVIVQIDEGLVR
jgi:hypothetical protein